MILGLDVSTSKIGYCVIDDNQKLLLYGFVKFKKEPFEERAWDFFTNTLKDIDRKYKIKEVRIEEPFSMFSGGKTTAGTMSKLQRFNGMISLMAYRCFHMDSRCSFRQDQPDQSVESKSKEERTQRKKLLNG